MQPVAGYAEFVFLETRHNMDWRQLYKAYIPGNNSRDELNIAKLALASTNSTDSLGLGPQTDC